MHRNVASQSGRIGLWWVSATLLLAPPLASAAEKAATPTANQPGNSDTATVAPEVSASAPAAQVTEAPKAKPTPEQDVRNQLDGTRWMIELSPLSGESTTKPRKDTVTFDARQVSSERLVKSGYPSTNYTLTMENGAGAVWETMQTKEGEGVVFWRGELNGSTMRGVLSKHPTQGNSEDFSFSGREASGKVIQVPPSATAPTSTAAAPAETAKPTPPTQPAPPEPKKKRKGLFGR